MAQAGDPTGTGKARFDAIRISRPSSTEEPFQRGTVGMAREAATTIPANSQFFICFADAPQLNGKYTVIGEVVSGMDVVDKIKKGEPPSDPDKIIKLRVAGDES